MSPVTPVTVLTGLPGSGKTLLLHHILAGAKGGRIAVVQNDPDGLVPALGALAQRQERVDRVLLETSGLASLQGVVQNLFLDRELREHYVLDGIVTMADAQRFPLDLSASAQAREQVAFADFIVINKTDLVCEAELNALERRLRAMNGIARIERARMAAVPRESVLGIGGFDFARGPDCEPRLHGPEHPFEWGGLYDCGAGAYPLELQNGPVGTVSIALLRVEEHETDAIRGAAEQASRLFSAVAVDRACGQVVLSGALHQRLLLNRRESTCFYVLLPVAGRYVLFTQHLPHKLNLTLTGPVLIGEHHFAPEQAHEGAVDCVRLTVEKPLHAARFQHWLERLLRGHGGDLIRLQGSLNFAGSTNQIVIQGVCQSIDTRVLEPWGDRPRATRLVLIGRRLAKRELYWRLQACGTGLSSHPCIDSRVL